MDTIVIVGIFSGYGQLVSKQLGSKYQIKAIGRKPNYDRQIPGPMARLLEKRTQWFQKSDDKVISIANKKNAFQTDQVKILVADIRQAECQNIFEQENVKAAIYLLGNTAYRLNRKQHKNDLLEFKKLQAYCVDYNVKKFIFLSTHEVYGPLPLNQMFLEEDNELAGAKIFPAMQNNIDFDRACANLFWQAPKMETVILRPVNVLGPTTDGLLNTYLKQKVAPSTLGFDPMMYVIHENDVALAIKAALKTGVKGIFNLTGPGGVPLSTLTESSGTARIPLPEPVENIVATNMEKFVKFPIPTKALPYFQYTICPDGRRFRDAASFSPTIPLTETVNSVG